MKKYLLIFFSILQSFAFYPSQSQSVLERRSHNVDAIKSSCDLMPQQERFPSNFNFRNPLLFTPSEKIQAVTIYNDEYGYAQMSPIHKFQFFDECTYDPEWYETSGFKASVERQQLLEKTYLDQVMPAIAEEYQKQWLRNYNAHIEEQRKFARLAAKIQGPLKRWRIVREKKLDGFAREYQVMMEQDLKDSDQEYAERCNMMAEEQLVIQTVKKEQADELKKAKNLKAMAILARKENEAVKKYQKKLLEENEAQRKKEQSRADKERHLLHLQELELQKQKDKNKLSSLKKNKEASPHGKRSQLQKKEIDRDDEFLNQAIAEKQRIKDEESAIDERAIIAELDAAILTGVEISNNQSSQQDDEPFNSDVLGGQLSEKGSEVQRYRQFVRLRTARLAELERKKEAQRKLNLEVINKTESVHRKAKQLELDQELEMTFGYISSDEEDIDRLFTRYQQITSPIFIQIQPLAVFKATEVVLKKLEESLAEEGKSLSWYLADHPIIYDLVKNNYIKFKRLMSSVDIDKMKQLREELNKSLDLSQTEHEHLRVALKTLMPVHKDISIFQILSYLHEVDGPLDVTRLLYEPVSAELIDSKGELPSDFLQRAEIDMQQKLKFNAISRDLDLRFLVPIVVRLVRQISIEPSREFINSIIRSSFEIALATKTKQNTEQELQRLKSSLFFNLQRENEMSLEAKTEDQMADIIKIHITVIKAILKTIQE